MLSFNFLTTRLPLTLAFFESKVLYLTFYPQAHADRKSAYAWLLEVDTVYGLHATSYSMSSAHVHPLVVSQVVTQQTLSAHLFHFKCALLSQASTHTHFSTKLLTNKYVSVMKYTWRLFNVHATVKIYSDALIIG